MAGSHWPAEVEVVLRRGAAWWRPGEAWRGPQPYFGIVPRSLVSTALSTREGAARWPSVAPILDRALTEASVGPVAPEPAASTAASTAWLELARARGVLSWWCSARLAARFCVEWGQREGWHAIGQRVDGRARSGEPQRLELQCPKEGHTASVWLARLSSPRWPRPLVLAVNVARDGAASEELRSSMLVLQSLHAVDPDGVAEVFEVDRIGRGHEGHEAVTVCAVEWLAGARELHVVPDRARGSGRFVVIHAFGGSDAAGVLRAHASPTPTSASDRLWRAVAALRLRLSVPAGDLAGSILAPDFELGDGDVVSRGDRLALVALSRPRPPCSLGRFIVEHFLLSASAGPASPRIYWNRPEDALAVLAGALEARPELPSIEQCLDLAAAELPSSDHPMPVIRRVTEAIATARGRTRPHEQEPSCPSTR